MRSVEGGRDGIRIMNEVTARFADAACPEGVRNPQSRWSKTGRRKPPSGRRAEFPHGMVYVMKIVRSAPSIITSATPHHPPPASA